MRSVRCWPALGLVLVLGCGGAFREAVDLGDLRAEQGRWDEAAAAYERAVNLDPDDPEAAQRLRWARRHQAHSRIQAASQRLAMGDALGALALVSEAGRLDPTHPGLGAVLAHVTGRVLDEAEVKARRGARRGALSDVHRVLAAEPTHQRALALDVRLRDEIATLGFERAAELAERRLVGNSLVELAGVLDVRPDWADARARLAEAQRTLRRDVTYYAVVGPLDADADLVPLAAQITPDRLAEGIPARLPLRIVASLPPDAPKEGAGIRLGAFLGDYAFRRRSAVEPRSCEYVCDRWLEDNPAYRRLEAQLRQAEARLVSAEAELSRRESELDRRRVELDRADQRVSAAERALEQARTKLRSCRRRGSSASADERAGAKRPCARRVERVKDREAEVDARRGDRTGPAHAFSSAEAQQAAATSARDTASERVDEARDRLRDTPPQVERVRHCGFDYDVTRHHVRGTMRLHFGAEELHRDRVVIDDVVSPLAAEHGDTTHPAHPGRCEEVVRADPLEIASEGQIRTALADEALDALRRRIRRAYESERTRLRLGAERARADGELEQAVELWVRFALTAEAVAEAEEAAVRNLGIIRGVPERAVHRALRP